MMNNLLVFGHAKLKKKGVFSMPMIIGWALVASGTTVVIVKALTDLGILR
jgi:hypothetical protein